MTYRYINIYLNFFIKHNWKAKKFFTAFLIKMQDFFPKQFKPMRIIMVKIQNDVITDYLFLSVRD